jgi:hypothetical protein
MARRHFPGEDPIGQAIRIGNAAAPTRTIVGVVGDVLHYDLRDRTTAQMYEPYPQEPYATMGIAVRADGDAEALTAGVRREVAALDAELPVFDVRTMEAALARTLAPQRSTTILLVLFAAMALALASIGIYGSSPAPSPSGRTRSECAWRSAPRGRTSCLVVSATA